jgi:hypothetical protein
MLAQNISAILAFRYTVDQHGPEMAGMLQEVFAEAVQMALRKIDEVTTRIAQETLYFFGTDFEILRGTLAMLIQRGDVGYAKFLARKHTFYQNAAETQCEIRFGQYHIPGWERLRPDQESQLYPYRLQVERPETVEAILHRTPGGPWVIRRMLQDFRAKFERTDLITDTDCVLQRLVYPWDVLVRAYQLATTGAYLETGPDDIRDKEHWQETGLYRALEKGFRELEAEGKLE